ncbi:hypothetical protein H0H93_006900 [Arthromyces matolae]|nr:hypothetical protein H0H93_006900 [Arthromyces matolae]
MASPDSIDLLKISQSRIVWRSMITSMAEQQLPIPGLYQSFDSFQPRELEDLARKTWLLHRNWTSGSPVITKTLSIKLDTKWSQEGGPPPTFEFFTRQGRQHLLTLSFRSRTPVHPLFDLQCWDIGGSSPRCIAHRHVNYGWVVVNKSPDSLAELAIQSPDIELLRIEYSAENAESGFSTIVKLPSRTARLVAFNDSVVVTRNHHRQLFISPLENSDSQIELQSQEALVRPPWIDVHFKTIETQKHPQRGDVLEVEIQSEVVIIIRQTGLEIFSIRDLDINQPTINPIVRHLWQWSLDSVSISRQLTWPQTSEYPTFNILVRFGSRLPWPVNLLHHFVLLPNAGFDPNLPVSPNNIPYSDTVVMRRSIGAPIRLFAKYHMGIGSRGTAIWIDSHTEDYFGRGDLGQRLAGSSARRTGDAEVDQSLQQDEGPTEMESSVDSAVFGYNENELWTRVAVEEEMGRVAVGFLDGNIEIREYA